MRRIFNVETDVFVYEVLAEGVYGTASINYTAEGVFVNGAVLQVVIKDSGLWYAQITAVVFINFYYEDATAKEKTRLKR